MDWMLNATALTGLEEATRKETATQPYFSRNMAGRHSEMRAKTQTHALSSALSVTRHCHAADYPQSTARRTFRETAHRLTGHGEISATSRTHTSGQIFRHHDIKFYCTINSIHKMRYERVQKMRHYRCKAISIAHHAHASTSPSVDPSRCFATDLPHWPVERKTTPPGK